MYLPIFAKIIWGFLLLSYLLLSAVLIYNSSELIYNKVI